MSDKDFGSTVAHLFRRTGIRQKATEDIQQGYTLQIDDSLQVDLIGLQQGFINLRAVIGLLPKDADSSLLLTLLNANDFAFEHPPVSLGVNPENATVTLWCRQSLAEIKHDEHCLWFERFIGIASVVQNWLHETQSAHVLPAKTSSAGIPSSRLSGKVRARESR